MRTSLYRLYPLFLGLILFNTLRAVTDLTKKELFWSGSMRMHLIAICFTISICYFYDFLWRWKLRGYQFQDNHQTVTWEYLIVFLQLAVINVFLLSGQYAGIFYMGSGWIDYMLINVCFIPLLLIYYTLIRNDVVDRNYKQKTAMLEKMKADKTEAELKLLKSQYHPHFLFNAMNTIYFQIDENNDDAKKSIETLSSLLRYQLYDIEKEVTMHQEINYLKAYISFQKTRMSQRLKLDIQLDESLKDQKIQSLLFQPVIENAFKYIGGDYSMKIHLKLDNKQIILDVENTISSMRQKEPHNNPGIGLSNLRKRLDLIYPDNYHFKSEQVNDRFYVQLIINKI